MARQLLEYHPVLAYRFIPNLRARVEHESGGYLVRANASGFRCNHDFVAARRPHVRRVLLFGDSFTAGDGVSNEKRYGDGLEQRIPNLEVYNFGLPGTGTDQHYLAYREFGRAIEHDLLVIAVLVENIRRITARFRTYDDGQGNEMIYAKPYFELSDGRLELRQVPPAREPVPSSALPESERSHVDRGGRFALLRKAVNKAGLRELVQKVTKYQPVPEYDSAEHPAWLLMSAILDRWIAEHQGPTMLVPLPLYQFIEETADPSAYQARFAELARRAGVLLHDPLPDLLEYPVEARRRFRFEKDIHLTPEGHAALAVSLAPALERALVKREPAAGG